MLFGIVALIVGFGSGYLMYTHPEGLNPEWPLGAAMVVPAVFILGGLHMVAAGLGFPGVARVTVLSAVGCLLAMANWAAFFTVHIHCVQTVSFLGIPVLRQYPSEAECRLGLRVIMGCVDALVLLLLVSGLVWSRRQKRKAAPTE